MTTSDHRLALPQGTRVQDFEFHRVLGHGGFGITYLGWNMALDIPVAIKEYLPADLAMREQDMSVLPKSSGDEADFHWGLDRFLDEARVMARFKHPNIVQVQHFFKNHGTACIVMEYVEGETLSDFLKRRGTLTESELKNILLPLLAGLIEVHEAGILHRDIKPGNILLRAVDGSPVLVDFGAARQAVGARSRSVTAVLTPGYAPIEQYSSRGHQGPWTDIYALGGVCYQALTGRVPDEAMDRIRQDPLIPITEAAKDKATEPFLSAIDWSLRVEEADRPQGIRIWRSALLGEEAIPEPTTGTATQTQQAPAPDRTPKTTTKWLPATGILLLIGAGTWWGIQEYPELFGQSPGETPAITEQETPKDTPAEIPQVTETQQTEATVASVEETPSPEKAEVEQSAPKEPALTPEEAEVARLLVAAEADLKARRLTSPAGNNAWEKYQHVLSLSAAHPEAMAGMERVIVSYMQLFSAAIEQEDFDQAESYLERMRELHPDSPSLLAGKKQLEEAKQAHGNRLAEEQRQAEEAARLAELDRQRQEAIKREYTGELVSIPGGTFRMGDLSEGGYDEELPVHSVTVSDFKLGKYEVTFAQWDACVSDGGCGHYTPDDEGWGRGNRPVIFVSWEDIQGYIDWLNDKTGGNFRLPTEAEWEYAARAGNSTKYSWGNSIGSNRANCDGCGSRWDDDRTAPVGSFSANAWGLHDLHGNVWEWVQDCWNHSYIGAPTDGSAWMNGNCTLRVIRGGSWVSRPGNLRSANRDNGTRSYRYDSIGFRLAQDK